MVRPSGLEPPTPTMSRWCSNQLSYERIVAVATGTHISGREAVSYTHLTPPTNEFV